MKIAIIGCGQIADAHIEEAKKIPGVEVAAVCDLNHHMARQAAVRYQIPGCYTDLDTMMKKVRPEVVHITTPPAGHLPIGKAVITYGAHIYMEKPFTVNLAEAEELVDIANGAGVQICVGHNWSFDPAFLRLRQIYSDGEIGAAKHIEAGMGYNLDGPFGKIFMGDPKHWLHKLPGGLAQNNISHPISLVMPFIPDTSLDVFAHGRRWRKQSYGDIRDSFFDEIRVTIFGENVSANITFSCQTRPVQNCVAIQGSQSFAKAVMEGRTVSVNSGASLPGPFAKLQWARKDLVQAKRVYRSHLRDLIGARLHYFGGLRELMRQFYNAVNGLQDMPIGMSEAIRTTAVMDQIFEQCQINDK